MIFRKRFGDVITRQLDLFEEDNAELLERIADARESYDEAARDEAEEKYGDYQELVAEGTDVLAELRDNYAATLEDGVATEYAAAFNLAVLRRFGDLALELADED